MKMLGLVGIFLLILTITISTSVLSITTQPNVSCIDNPYSVNCVCPEGLEKHKSNYGTYLCITPGGCIGKGDMPCAEAVWYDIPDCEWDTSGCLWQPTSYCPMTCDDAMNGISWATGIGITIESEIREAANYGCSRDGFIEMICKCGVVAGEFDGYDCSDYTGDFSKNEFCSESQLVSAATSAGLSPEQVRQRLRNACSDYEGNSDYTLHGDTIYALNTFDGSLTVSCHSNVLGLTQWSPDQLTKVKLWHVKFDSVGNFVSADFTKYSEGLCFKYDEWY